MKKIDPEVKVLLSSGFSREEDIVSMKEAGLQGFIRKPFRQVVLSLDVSDAIS